MNLLCVRSQKCNRRYALALYQRLSHQGTIPKRCREHHSLAVTQVAGDFIGKKYPCVVGQIGFGVDLIADDVAVVGEVELVLRAAVDDVDSEDGERRAGYVGLHHEGREGAERSEDGLVFWHFGLVFSF